MGGFVVCSAGVRVRRRIVWAVAAVALGLAASTPARADCQPSPAVSGQTVTCAGTDLNGFQAGAGVNNLTVNVLAGASVFDNGTVAIRVRNLNAVTNNGTITAGAGVVGIRAGNDNVIANFVTIMTGNGGTGIVAGDRNTIDNSGSITAGRFGTGIVAGDHNTITNSGTIATGRSGTGVSAGNQNTVTNARTITTGRFGTGIMAGDRNTVTNAGTITTGRSGAGIVAGDRNTVDNSGTITTGRSGAGIVVGDRNTVTSSGTITTGRGGAGIVAGDRNAVTNSGAITTGRSGVGIVAGDRNTIDNAGTITTGRFGTGIQADDHNIITNSGTIATGRLGIGMSVGNRNAIANAGTITTAAFGVGIQAGNHNTIDNAGAIATGRFGAGIVAGKRNAVTNTGTITGGDGSVGILALKRNNVVNDGNITVGPAGTGIAIGFGNTVINNGSVVAGANGVSIGACFLCFLPSINNTVVNNGTLDGQIALFGFGNQLTNAGLITITDPGTPVGAAHEIDGSFTQTATGTLALRVNAAGVSDQLFASSAHLAGTLFVAMQPGLYGSVTTYNGVVVACSCGGLNGTKFDSVVASSIFFNATATYDYAGVTAPIFDPNVSLTLTRIPFGALPGETPNQRAVGNALEAAYSTSLTGNAATFFINLLQATSAKVFDQLSGEGTSGTQQTAFLAQNLFISVLMGQGALWRQDAPDAGVGAPMQYAPAEPELPVFKALNAQPAADARTDPRTDPRTWRMWAAGFGGNQSLRGDAAVGSADLSGRTAGGAFGAEYRANPDLLIGFGIGGSSSSFSVPDRSTSGQLDGGHAGIYGVARWNDAYLAGTLTYSRFDNQTTRTIAGVGPTETANGNFAGDELGGRLEAGRRYGFGAFAVTPFAAIQFAELWQRGYTETSTTILGAPGVLGLSYQPQATFSLPTFLGAQLDSRVVLGNAVFTPFVRASWVHEFEPSRQISGSLVTIPMPFFTVDGARAAADALRIDAGVKLALTRAVALYANGAGEFSNLGQTYAATGGLRINW